ncbi:phage Gp37/Gp68 family protein [Paraburkholderia sp. JHI2823]|uniref:phage Gp37/Gp68 family protein n=1 Tax=Paraburkholderia sp. JHI2823 TaxID=3112960 RepID=UPI00317F8C1D
MENTTIEWADHTLNPWEGCQSVSRGCDNCYAQARNARFSRGVAPNWGPGAPRRRTAPATWDHARRWNAKHEAFFATHKRRQRVFCASLADVFDNAVPDAWRIDLFQMIAKTPNLDWLLLTKRIGNVRAYMQRDGLAFDLIAGGNVWLGATVVDQIEADRDVPKLLATPARVRFVSMEPLLGPVTLPFDRVAQWNMLAAGHNQTNASASIDWVIVGGESGPYARPMHPGWASSLQAQCAAAGVPFFFKQWGEWLPALHASAEQHARAKAAGSMSCFGLLRDGADAVILSGDDAYMLKVGKKHAGRLLGGVTHNSFPEDGEPGTDARAGDGKHVF